MTIAMLDYLRDELHVTRLRDLGHGGFADVYSGEKDEVLQAFKVSREPLDQKLRDMAAQELSFMKTDAIRACDHIVQLRGVHWHLGHLITRWDLGEQSLGDRLKAYADTKTPFHFGSQSNGKEANVDGNSLYGTTVKGPYLPRTTTVGLYAKNAFGLSLLAHSRRPEPQPRFPGGVCFGPQDLTT